jgi:hypothetical protein
MDEKEIYEYILLWFYVCFIYDTLKYIFLSCYSRRRSVSRYSIYYKKNREKILAKRKETYTCSCGSTLTKAKKKRHEQSKKHQIFIAK